MNAAPRFSGFQTHCCNAGREALAGFCKNDISAFIVSFSRVQVRGFIEEFAECLDARERSDFRRLLDEPDEFPEEDSRPPIRITGDAATSINSWWRAHHRLTRDDAPEFSGVGYDDFESRVIGFFYPDRASSSTTTPDAIIALKDDNRYHVYIAYSRADALAAFAAHPRSVRSGLAPYTARLINSMLPLTSPRLMVHLGDAAGAVAARDICLWIDAERMERSMTEGSA